jgi:hydrogenase expression/formation protein HypC
MCLAIPGKVVSIDKSEPELTMAKVDFGGIKSNICSQLIPDLEVGDYVLVHAGFALSKISEEEAKETINMFKEIDKLSESD